ncbi:hypothetical protein M8C21_010362 [Ambrosia artemisiifolia]|uniref:HTH myb-type domain-containing protein n=1 Tax=Ambrosia artemisiifolia TaxID=4212 RepID=A0AAD5C405_AMBAR|nr:hypothetical protein M8C21_010362 [Ambrosia artemisiifolia]
MVLKEEAMVFKKSSRVEPVFEEFIPLKKSCDEEVEEDRDVEKDDLTVDGSHQPFPGRAFIPLKGCYGFTMVGTPGEKDGEELPIPGLSLVTPGIGIKNSMRGNNLVNKTSPNTKLTPCFAPNDQSNGVVTRGQSPQQHSSRKQRRCWSTELHRRFVNALQQLGGSQAATPKQIRELMQVEGLTNDEVKSHLQKYRLHTRRLPSSNASSANQTVGVLGGGMWTPPQDQYIESSKHGISQSSSPDGPFLTGTTTTTGGDSMDDGEDAKSENYCWKGV